MLALYTAASGMAAQELAVQVISNNIANLSTTDTNASAPSFRTCCTTT
jgi:flagellar basal-body rod protein FlgG